jgi:DNA-binding NarL/FixJ family response regulator
MLEVEVLSAVIATIYDAALDPESWPAALEGIRGFVRGCAANFYWQDVSKENAGVFHCVGIEPAHLETYFQTYTRFNPLYPTSAFFPPGEVFGSAEVLPFSEFEQTRFFQEWMRPQRMIDSVAVNLEKSVTSVAALAVIRGDDDGLADEESRRRMRWLAPHVLRASAIGHVVADHMRSRAVLTDALDRIAAAVLLVDTAGRTVFANAAADAMLASAKLLRSSPAGLAAIDPVANRALQLAIGASSRAEEFDAAGSAILLSADENERWLAHVLPLNSGVRLDAAVRHSAAAAIFVRKASLDIPSPLETVARLYRLTGSEVRVLHAIVDTGGVPDIAAALGVSESTVRTHLKRLFEKTATHRQVDLVKLVAAHASPFS